MTEFVFGVLFLLFSVRQIYEEKRLLHEKNGVFAKKKKQDRVALLFL